jgi:hypothetical protein
MYTRAYSANEKVFILFSSPVRSIIITSYETMQQGYTFEAKSNGHSFTVKVPMGGIKHGQKFSVPFPLGSIWHSRSKIPGESVLVGHWKVGVKVMRKVVLLFFLHSSKPC